MVGPAAKREAVAHLRNVLQMSERRAKRAIITRKMTAAYRSQEPVYVFRRFRAVGRLTRTIYAKRHLVWQSVVRIGQSKR
jgi:hypothetical protein